MSLAAAYMTVVIVIILENKGRPIGCLLILKITIWNKVEIYDINFP